MTHPAPNNTEDRQPQIITPPSAWLRVSRLAAILMMICAVTFISVVPQVSNDFWLQAKVGEIIAQTHTIPKTILFPFTEVRDAPFNAHEWLPSILFYWLINSVGEDGLPLIIGLAGLALFALMTSLAYRRTEKSLPLALLLGLLAVSVENYRHFLRPELFSLFLLGFYWHLLESCRRTPHLLAWLGALLVVVVWTNSHGSFVLAPVIAAIYAVGLWLDGWLVLDARNESQQAKLKAFAIFTCAVLGVTLINPVGIEIWAFVLDFGRSDVAKVMVVEWLPTFDPRWRELRGLWIGLWCASVTAAAMLIRWRRLSAVDVLLFFIFLVLALKAIRFLVYLGMVAAYVLPALLPSGWQAAENRTRMYAICTVVSGVVLGLAIQFGNAFGSFPHTAGGMNASLTNGMVNQLKAPELKGNVINSYELGAELVYRAYPRLRPSMDSRIDSYGAEWTSLNARLFLEDKLLTDFVKDYDVRYMLLNHGDFQQLQKLPNWTQNRWWIRAMDQRAVLLQRSDLPSITR